MTVCNINILSKFKFFYSRKLSALLLKNPLGLVILKLPTIFYTKLDAKSLSLIFINRFFYKSSLTHLLLLYNKISVSFFFKLRIKGLGYRIRSISNSIFYFFFNYTNFFYFFVPKSLVIKTYKRKMFFFSFDWCLLKLVLSHVLLLKNIGPYDLQGFRLARQIIYLKKSGKKV